MNKRLDNSGYFDIEIDLDKLAMEDLSNAFLLQDLKQRKLFLETEIEGFYSVSDIIKNIMQYNSDDDKAGLKPEERKPILLHIASIGGDVPDGMALIDVIAASKTPVYTINIGYACSMAFYIMICGHKRFSYPNARFLLHEGTDGAYDSTSKVRDRIKFEDTVEERIKELVVRHSNLTYEEYDKNYMKEWYMFPQEAKERGFIDHIVGEDCELSAIV